MDSSKKGWSLGASRFFQRVGMLLVMSGLLFGLALNAAAADLGPLNAVTPWTPWLLVLGVIFLAIGYFGRGAVSARTRGVLNLFGGLFIVIVILIALAGWIPMGPGDGDVPPGTQHTFTVNGEVDVTGGDTYPAGDYDSCDTENGGTTSEWTTTEGTLDPTTNSFIARVAIDTDLAITAALWTEPNCLRLDFSVRLNTPVDLNGDGTNDAITYFAQVTSISRTTLATDGSNGSVNAQGFVRDGISETGDWLILYQTDASVWIPACQEFRSSSLMGSSCGPVAVGSHAGAAAADTVSLVMHLEDRGLFAYQEPGTGTGVNVGFTVAGKAWTLSILLNSRGTTNLA
jgi:hypothetical protein